MDEAPSIGVVVLNWKGASLTLACLDSLHDSRIVPSRVVVVDNASADGSIERFVRWAGERQIPFRLFREGEEPGTPTEWLTIVEANSNRGFAPGNNLGIRFLRERTACTHVLLLNNDATVAPDFFDEIARALQRVPEAGLVTGTIYEDHGDGDRSVVWYAGGIEIPGRALTGHLHSVPESDNPVETQFVSGCAMLISGSALDAVGDLAECYSPVYWEDAEYSHRVRAHGMKLIYAPRAVVYHRVGSTVGPARESPLVTYCQNRHRVFFVRRNYRGKQRILALGYLFATKPARALFEILRGNGRIGTAILRGFANGLLSSSARSD